MGGLAVPWHRGAELAMYRGERSAEQSRDRRASPLDCFAPLAM